MEPRVEILVGEWADGGVERVTYNLLTRLDRKRFRVSVVIARLYETRFELPEGVEVVTLGAKNVRSALPRIVRHLRRSPPDILISHMTLPNAWSLVARRLLHGSYPIVCVEHNTLSVEYGYGTGLQRLLPRLLRLTHPSADALVSVSRASAADLAGLLAPKAPPIEVIYNPIVSPSIDTLAREPAAHPWLDDDAYRVVLGAARLTRQKNFGLLVEAFAEVVQSDSRARLVILGEGIERELLERKIEELGLDDVVALPGFVPNPYPSMRRAAVFALPSIYEGLPTALVEAMACGTPVVAADTPGGVREVIGDGQYGILTPPGDSANLAKAILGLLESSPWTEEQLRQRASQFSIEAAVEAYENLLQSLLDTARARAP